MKRTFGRIIHFDGRSRAYPIRALLPRDARPRSYTWTCPKNLDQGSEGACCGYAVAHEAAARPVCVKGITNAVARALYRRAQLLDDFPGEDYEGSTVLGAMKAGREKGWYEEFRFAFGEEDLILTIGYRGPCVLGIYWYEGMSHPDEKGYILPTGKRLGGHAILCNGYDAKKQLYRLHNSWGPRFGINGDCFVSRTVMAELLNQQGEAAIPVVRGLGK